jgi:beta-carotene hydroxylase
MTRDDTQLGEGAVTADILRPDALLLAGDRPALPLGPDGLDRYTRRDLRQEEAAIARQFHGGAMWPYAVAAFGCFTVWVAFFPLAIMGG